MKYIPFLILLIPFLQLIWGCGGTTVNQPGDIQAKLDSITRRPDKFTSKFVCLDGHTYEENWNFQISDTALVVDNGNCPISYTLYNGGTMGATTYRMWFSDAYVSTIRITVKREEGNKKIQSVQLNRHIFTNEPCAIATTPKEEYYIVKKGDTATRLSKKFDIPVNQLPNPLIIGTKIKL